MKSCGGGKMDQEGEGGGGGEMDQEGEGGEKWTGSFLPPGEETDWGGGVGNNQPVTLFPENMFCLFMQIVSLFSVGVGGVGVGAGIRKISSTCRLLYLPRAW